MRSDALRKAQEKYDSGFDFIRIRVPKDGTKELIQKAAEQAGMSVNAFVLQAIEEKMKEAKA